MSRKSAEKQVHWMGGVCSPRVRVVMYAREMNALGKLVASLPIGDTF